MEKTTDIIAFRQPECAEAPLTGIGALDVQRPKVRDRAPDGPAEKKIRFTSAVLPKWARRSRSLDALLPVLYLRGISMGVRAFLRTAGSHALTPGGAGRDLGERRAEPVTRCDLPPDRGVAAGIRPFAVPRPFGGRHVYIQADGVSLQARIEPQAECTLVILGVAPEGKKKLVGFRIGVRSAGVSCWSTSRHVASRFPRDRRGQRSHGVLEGARRGLSRHAPSALLGPQARQRAQQVSQIHAAGGEGRPARDIWQAETRAAAATAMDTFVEKYGAKYEKAVACLSKDREALLAFYDLPADHWDPLRTGNSIGSVFATVRHRTVRTKGALSQKTAKLMVFKLVQAAAKTWRRLKGANQLPLIIEGVTSPRVSPPASPKIAPLD
jgi:putative transposase